MILDVLLNDINICGLEKDEELLSIWIEGVIVKKHLFQQMIDNCDKEKLDSKGFKESDYE